MSRADDKVIIVRNLQRARNLGAAQSRGQWRLGDMLVLTVRSVEGGALRGRALRAVFVEVDDAELSQSVHAEIYVARLGAQNL